MHNLALEGLDSKMADPREEFRWENLRIVEPDISDHNIDEIATKMDSLEAKEFFRCDQCGAGYSKKGYLKRQRKVNTRSSPKTRNLCAVNAAKCLRIPTAWKNI